MELIIVPAAAAFISGMSVMGFFPVEGAGELSVGDRDERLKFIRRLRHLDFHAADLREFPRHSPPQGRGEFFNCRQK